MVDTLFQVGDRVRVRVSTAFVQAGTWGTVRAWYPVMPDAYDVEFDGHQKSWMMWDDELEAMLEEAPIARTRSADMVDRM